MTISDITRLGGIVFIAVTLIVIGDTFGKLLGQNGVPAPIIAFSRFFIGALVILPISGVRLSELRGMLDWRIFLRGALITCGILSILTALKTEPIANVFGAFFIGPIVAYIGAIVLLGERPTLYRGILLAVGFIGVLLVVQPGKDMGVGMIFALMAGTFYGGFIVVTRMTVNLTRPRLLLLSQLAIGSTLLSPLAIAAPMPDIDGTLAFWVIGSALGSAAGNYLLVIASRQAEASLIAPLIYLQLLSATVISLVVFNDVPDALTLIGLVVILMSGVGTLWVKLQETQQSSNV